MFTAISTIQGYRTPSLGANHEQPTITGLKKLALITDIALVIISMSAGSCAILAVGGTNLGLLNVMGTIGTIYGIGLIGGGVVVLTADGIAHLVVKVKHANLYIQALTTEKDALSTTNNDLKAKADQLDGLESGHAGLQDALKGKDAEIDRLKAILTKKEEGLESTSKNAEDLNAKLKINEENRKQLATQFMALKAANSELEKVDGELKSEIAKLKEELESKESNLKKLNEELEVLTEANAGFKSKIDQSEKFESEIETLRKELESKESNLKKLSEETEILKEQKSNLEKRLKELELDVTNLKENKSELEDQIIKLNSKIENLSAKKEWTKSRNDQLFIAEEIIDKITELKSKLVRKTNHLKALLCPPLEDSQSGSVTLSVEDLEASSSTLNDSKVVEFTGSETLSVEDLTASTSTLKDSKIVEFKRSIKELERMIASISEEIQAKETSLSELIVSLKKESSKIGWVGNGTIVRFIEIKRNGNAFMDLLTKAEALIADASFVIQRYEGKYNLPDIDCEKGIIQKRREAWLSEVNLLTGSNS